MGLVQKAFSDIITFSRSSNATRVGPTGVLEYAPHNLLLQSQTFQTTWTSDANRGSITADAAAAPDGTVTADKLLAGSDNFAYRYQNLTIVNSTVYTASAYLKSAELTFGYLEVPGGGITYFNLSTGVISSLGSGATATITSVGNGWYRCSVTFTSNTTSGYVNLGAANASGSQAATNGSGIYLWGAQLAVGPYALDYTPTTSAAVYGPRFDYDGSGVTIVEPVSTNLVLYSQEFDNAAWAGATTAGSVSANATTSPDGTVNADLFIPDTSSSATHRAIQFTSTSSGTFSVSVYAKAAGYSRFFVFAGGANQSALFDLTTQTVVADTRFAAAPSNMTITAIGNGWYRCSFSTNISAAVTNVQITVLNSTANPGDSWTGNGTSGLYIWGAQLEVGSTATAYMVSGATNGFRAVPVVTGNATPKGLLVEEQRTNTVTYSEQFDNAAWIKYNASSTANSATAPDGTLTADLCTAGGSDALLYQLAPGAGTYTFSIYAKSGAGSTITLACTTSFAGVAAQFDLSAGTAGAVTTYSGGSSGSITGGASSIQNVGNGWYRCVLANVTVSGSLAFHFGPTQTNGTATGTINTWGAQLEAGSFATSYIPTLASTVTRSADVASVNTLSPWFSSGEGTAFVEWVPMSVSGFRNVLTTDLGGTRRFVYQNSTTAQAFDGTNVIAASGAISANSTQKAATAYGSSTMSISLNGGTVGSGSFAGSFTGSGVLYIGATTTNSEIPTGWFRRVAFYPRKLSSAEIQALTA